MTFYDMTYSYKSPCHGMQHSWLVAKAAPQKILCLLTFFHVEGVQNLGRDGFAEDDEMEALEGLL